MAADRKRPARPADSVLERREQIEAPVDPKRYATLLRWAKDPEVRLVVGLGGGSIPGVCANLGLTRLLEELDIRQHVDEIWGTSAGSVVGGGWASGATALEILQKVQGLEGTGAGKIKVRSVVWRLLKCLKPFNRPLPDGLVDGTQFVEQIGSGLRCDRIEDTEIPFRCIACSDDGNYTRKVFRKGPLLPAIFSSMSIPGIVIPQPGDEEGNTYYDGGILEKTPLKSVIADHVRIDDGRRLVLICTHFGNEAVQVPQSGFLRRLLATLSALEDELWAYQLAEARTRQDVTVVLLNPKMYETGMFDFGRAERMYLAAREIFAQQLSSSHITASLGGV